MDKAKLGQLVTDCLNSTHYMSLATVEDNQPHSCTILFSVDWVLNFYFISNINSKHIKNILENPKVALSLYKFNSDPKDEKNGVQALGKAEVVSDKDLPEAFDAYFSKFGQEDNLIENYQGNSDWKFIKVTPTELYYFDTKNFGEEKQKII